MKMKVIHPLDPIVDENAKVLILGSFPSQKSREMMFYYAHPTNRFWPVLSSVFEEEITDRKQFCLKHRIALWDVIHSCTIQGSSDASITDVTVNDIEALLAHTDIKVIFTTGRKASDLFNKYIHVDVCHISLPSTSAANAKEKLTDLVRQYSVIKEFLNEA